MYNNKSIGTMAQNLNSRYMSEDDKIITVTRDYLNATSKETAVTMEEIIAKAIEVGFTTDCWLGVRGKEGYMKGDHPWWFNAPMVAGVGTKEQLANHEDVHFHRESSSEKMNERSTRDGDDDDRMTTVFRYWYDGNSFHTPHVRKSPKTKAEREAEAKKEERRKVLEDYKASQNKPKTVTVPLVGKKDGKIHDVSVNWINRKREEAEALYHNVEAALANM